MGKRSSTAQLQQPKTMPIDVTGTETRGTDWVSVAGIVALVAIGVAVMQDSMSPQNLHESRAAASTNPWDTWPLPAAYNSYKSIKVIDWDPSRDDKSQIQEIIATGRPVVIRNSPVAQKWKALERWRDPEYLMQHVEQLRGVRYKATSGFTNEAQLAYAKLAIEEGLVDGPSEAVMDLSPEDFLLHDTSEKGNGMHYYYAATLKHDFHALMDDVTPYDMFNVTTISRTSIGEANGNPRAGTMDLGVKSFTPYIWMTHGGNAAAAHFDVAFNFNVQVVGHKRFILQPISAWPSLHIHPNYHLSRRQSRLDLRSPVDPTQYPLFNPNGEAYQVVLSPGEVLYVPPYMFHSVETFDFCINVNFFSDYSDLEQVLSGTVRPKYVIEAFKQGLHAKHAVPLVASMLVDLVSTTLMLTAQNPAVLCTVSTDALSAIAETTATQKLKLVHSLLSTSIQSRFVPDLKRLGCHDWDQTKCPSIEYGWGAELASLEKEYIADRNKVLEAVRSQTCAGTLPHGALELWLLDWMEQIVSRNLGVKVVCSYLRCLDAILEKSLQT